MFLEELGLKESGLEKLIKASYSLLGLISYLTAGPTETRAWTIKKEQRRPRLPEKSTPILSGALLRPKLSATKISWPAKATL